MMWYKPLTGGTHPILWISAQKWSRTNIHRLDHCTHINPFTLGPKRTNSFSNIFAKEVNFNKIFEGGMLIRMFTKISIKYSASLPTRPEPDVIPCR